MVCVRIISGTSAAHSTVRGTVLVPARKVPHAVILLSLYMSAFLFARHTLAFTYLKFFFGMRVRYFFIYMSNRGYYLLCVI